MIKMTTNDKKKTIARAQREVARRESGAKWKRPWGRGRVVLGQEPILALIVNIGNI